VDNLEQNKNANILGWVGVLSFSEPNEIYKNRNKTGTFLRHKKSILSIDLRQFDARHNVAPPVGGGRIFLTPTKKKNFACTIHIRPQKILAKFQP